MMFQKMLIFNVSNEWVGVVQQMENKPLKAPPVGSFFRIRGAEVFSWGQVLCIKVSEASSQSLPR